MHKTLRDKTPSVLLTVFVCSRFVVLRGGWEWVSFDCFQIKMLVTYVGMVYVGLWMSQAHIPQVRLLILARTIWHRSSNSECPKKNSLTKRTKINGPKQIWWFRIFYTFRGRMKMGSATIFIRINWFYRICVHFVRNSLTVMLDVVRLFGQPFFLPFANFQCQ